MVSMCTATEPLQEQRQACRFCYADRSYAHFEVVLATQLCQRSSNADRWYIVTLGVLPDSRDRGCAVAVAHGAIR